MMMTNCVVSRLSYHTALTHGSKFNKMPTTFNCCRCKITGNSWQV